MVAHDLKVFAGPGNPALAGAVAEWLHVPLGRMSYSRFPDGENYVRFDESVRGADAFIIQPTCAPVDTNLMVLLEAVDALRRASTWRITPVIPYYGYSRQERKNRPREPITAKLVADMITVAGAHRVMCLDLHADAIQGFFNIPVDHLTAEQLFVEYFAKKMKEGMDNLVVVSPDEGRVKKVRRVVYELKAPLAVGYKHHPGQLATEITHLAGDVRGKTPVIIEDMITTGGSVLQAVDALLEHGCAPQVHIAATHGVFADGALERLCARKEIAEIVVTDSVPLARSGHCDKLHVLSVAPLFGEAIRRANNDLSITSLFD